MARAMWRGAIQFGLVTIPVKLYVATESKAGISFNMLHDKDLSRIQMKIYCPQDDKIIQRTDTVKGYEWQPGEYVVITDEDLEKLPLKTVRSIEIEQFVARDETGDGVGKFVKSAYYIEPDKIGRKAFYLLRSVLEDRGLSAICKVVIKDREALAALDPFDDTMILTTLHWPDEIRDVKELDLPEEKFEFKAAEKAMAEQLVSAMTGDFDPSAYKDEYREALMKVIEAKVEGREVAAPAPEPASNLVDLMAALEASVNAAKASRSGEKPVSVREARAKSEARAKAAGEAAAGEDRDGKEPARKPASAKAKSASEEREEKPARRRKTA
ncbi:MAG TPA: Ku protein [Candidatus Limnocylindrales bacterium]|jgi:DNA end-binding protein Ku